MSVLTSHPAIALPALGRLRVLLGTWFHDIATLDTASQPAEFRRMSDRMLRDIGIDPRSVPADGEDEFVLESLRRWR